MIVEFIENDVPINGKKYKKGDTMSVSSSISKSLLGSGLAKEYKPKKKKQPKAEE